MKKQLLLSILLLTSAVARAQIITTVAGNPTGTDDDGIAAVDAKLRSPWAVAADGSGNIYVSDVGSCTVRKIDASGIITTVVGTGTCGYNGDGIPAATAQLKAPYGLAVDAAGDLYIADNGNHRIRKVSAGLISTVAGTGYAAYSGDGSAATVACLHNPYDVTFDKQGNLYIADAGNMAIRKVATTGIISTVKNGFSSWLPPGSEGYTGELWFPSNARLSGLAVDTAGNVYIADYWSDIIRKVEPGGYMTTIAGTTSGFSGDGGAAESAALYGPKKIAIDHQGNIIFSDNQNYRVRSISPSGIITTIAGNNSYGYHGDGMLATAASLDKPVGVAIDAAGNLLIADNGNGRVRKVNIATAVIQNATTLPQPAELAVPNPTTGKLLVRTDGPGTFILYAIDGKRVALYEITTREAKIDLANTPGADVPAGLYFCVFYPSCGGNVQKQTMVVQ